MEPKKKLQIHPKSCSGQENYFPGAPSAHKKKARAGWVEAGFDKPDGHSSR
jgi:hypothetical protein